MKQLLSSFIGLLFVCSAKATITHIPQNYSTIQPGIDSSQNGDTILVDPGTYFGNLNFHGKNITLSSLYLTTGDTAYIDSTIITGSPIWPITGGGSIVTFENNESSAARLVGFTITGGTGNQRRYGAEWVLYGGGIFCDSASPTISHLTIKSNTAGCGGGIFLRNSGSVVENCTIRDHLLNSIMFTSPDAGGAIAFWNCTHAIFRNNKILNDTVSTAGAGIYSITSSVAIVNCLFTNNYSMSMGSAIYADSHSKLTIANCTFNGNHSDYETGGLIYCIDSTDIHINNSIFWNNYPSLIVCQFNYGRNIITVSHSDFEGGLDSIITSQGGNNVSVNWLGGNINTDPLFVNASANNYHLLSTSPCINAGDTAGLGNIIPYLDLDDSARISGTIDMGCYESHFPLAIVRIENENNIRSFPNPVSDYLFVERTNAISQKTKIALINTMGLIVALAQLDYGQTHISLKVSNLAAGFYFLEAEEGQNHFIDKIIIVH